MPYQRFVSLSVLAITTTGCSIEKAIIKKFFVPKVKFEDSTLPPKPDYSQDKYWATLPETDHKANLTPEGAATDSSLANVFFIHPTTMLSQKGWVQDPVKEDLSKEMLDELIVSGMASVFNGCCSIYTPRYRQATFGSYYVPAAEANAVFSIAYEDIETAFDYFIEELAANQPFILAAHSQGALHGQRLLEKIDKDPKIRNAMVAAYIGGHKFPRQAFGTSIKNIPLCESAEQTGCVISWNTYGKDFNPYRNDVPFTWKDEKINLPERAPIVCTNPITWTTKTGESDKSAHLGAVPQINTGVEINEDNFMKGETIGMDVTRLGSVQSGFVSAACDEEGVLRINDIRKEYKPANDKEDEEYHDLDYELFYMDIRSNAILRAQAWTRANTPIAPVPAEPADENKN